jgi:galactokinase
MSVDQFCQEFERLFSSRPRIFRAPGRINLIGEHTDYSCGFVLPAAIGFVTYAAISPRVDGKLVIQSREFTGTFEFPVDDLPKKRTGRWCDYVLGIALAVAGRGCRLEGANLLVHGEVPIGAGLSSSAALEVACALALMSLDETKLPLPELAKLCREAENTFVGARVGIMDPFVSCMGKAGHALLLDCRSLEFKLVPIPQDIRLVVCNTMVKHDLATGTYNTRRQECEQGVRYFSIWDHRVRALRDVSLDLLDSHQNDMPHSIWKRCSHVVHENQRTIDAANALTTGDSARVGTLMRESHASLRDLYQVSCPELDIMVEAAEALPGFFGGRMMGGGFGGSTINLVRQECAEDFAARIAERYRMKTGIDPQIYLCAAESGAGQIG